MVLKVAEKKPLNAAHGLLLKLKKKLWKYSREGLIIEWPLKRQFHDVVIIVITSRVAVIELVDNDNIVSINLGILEYK